MGNKNPKFENSRFNDIQSMLAEIEKEYPNYTTEEICSALQNALSEMKSTSIEELKEKIKSYLSKEDI